MAGTWASSEITLHAIHLPTTASTSLQRLAVITPLTIPLQEAPTASIFPSLHRWVCAYPNNAIKMLLETTLDLYLLGTLRKLTGKMLQSNTSYPGIMSIQMLAPLHLSPIMGLALLERLLDFASSFSAY